MFRFKMCCGEFIAFTYDLLYAYELVLWNHTTVLFNLQFKNKIKKYVNFQNVLCDNSFLMVIIFSK